ncbi:MAG TPA: imidazole glycerol phosphate synthase subunit HisF [Flavobacteriales bacterium]|jgi:cyclase|nr:imidazole glycerol phosphate synthase subunit HisF [Flavobacteriales bacterium]
MAFLRIVARLDVKGSNLIKGVHLEGLRVIGDPNEFAKKYYAEGIDEIIYMDTVASLYGRNNLTDVIRRTAKDVYVPITVGGGIRSVADAQDILRSGADKVAINTAATVNPELLREVAQRFGAQCLVLSIEAKQQNDGTWEAYSNNGREHTGLDVVEWAKQGTALGAGEILLTSVDREGTRKGFDLELLKSVSDAVSVPVIASGGMGSMDHFAEAVHNGGVDAIAMADILHYNRMPLSEIRKSAAEMNMNVRTL